MTTPIAIPNYVGQVEITTQPKGEHDWVLIPCWKINFHDGLSADALYSAASSPAPDVFPGLSDPGLLEFWGPWRTDFNPYTSATPTFRKGQTVQVTASIYAGTLDGLMPQALVALIEWHTDMTIIGSPFWHMLLVGNWQFNGLAQTGVTANDWSRGQGQDNNANTSGYT